MTSIMSVVLVVLVLFTQRGPVYVVEATDDLAACQAMAVPDFLEKAFVGKKVPVKDGQGNAEEVLVLDAQAMCWPVTQLHHA